MTTREAFKKLISARAVHNQLGISSAAVRHYRADIKKKEWPSTDLMSELLAKAGYKVKQEKLWEKE